MNHVIHIGNRTIPETEIMKLLAGYQISGKDCSFAKLAREYSAGLEAQTFGLIEQVDLSTPIPELAKIFSFMSIFTNLFAKSVESLKFVR